MAKRVNIRGARQKRKERELMAGRKAACGTDNTEGCVTAQGRYPVARNLDGSRALDPYDLAVESPVGPKNRQERRIAQRIDRKLEAAEARFQAEGRMTGALTFRDEGVRSWTDLDEGDRIEILEQRDRSLGPAVER